jgi:hypothetical protein
MNLPSTWQAIPDFCTDSINTVRTHCKSTSHFTSPFTSSFLHSHDSWWLLQLTLSHLKIILSSYFTLLPFSCHTSSSKHFALYYFPAFSWCLFYLCYHYDLLLSSIWDTSPFLFFSYMPILFSFKDLVPQLWS